MANDVYMDIKDNTTPVSQATFNELQKLIKQDIASKKLETLKLAFPVGQPYITQNNTNPSTILGFGTWERVKGRVLVGLDENDTDFNTFKKTGGEKKHTLTLQEIAKHAHWKGSHQHTFAATTSSAGRHTHGARTRNGALGAYEFSRPVGWDGQQYRTITDGAGEHTHYVSGSTSWNGEGNTEEAGGNQAHNNLQPYYVVGYLWVRVS